MTDQYAHGRCFCGGVEYRIELPTEFVTHCHCRSCQLSHASAFATWTAVPLDRFEFVKGEDTVTWYRSSECILWGFCSVCGSSLFYRADREGHHESPKIDRMYLSAACLDQLDRYPGAHVSWEEHSGLLERFFELARFRGKTNERME